MISEPVPSVLAGQRPPVGAHRRNFSEQVTNQFQGLNFKLESAEKKIKEVMLE